LKDGDYAYFVHSYALPVSADTLATADYGSEFTAVAARGNFHGAQFHPERSARVGALLLANFLRLPTGTR
jgi:glutamine amidotransferase